MFKRYGRFIIGDNMVGNLMKNQAEYLYTVVANKKEQYSIWPAGQTIPIGWRSLGQLGSKEACLAYINQVWTDTGSLNLHKHSS